MEATEALGVDESGEILLTALLVTYNHERYIAQALESILDQETDFGFEIIVSEDCSTDGTLDIVRKYEAQYPGRISIIASDVNLRSVDVVMRAVAAAKGRYIAFLDGDDYWVSKDKLQKQFDFMESHPDTAISYHEVARVAEDGEIVRLLPGSPHRATVEDLIQGNFLPSCSCVTRRSAIENPPGWIRNLHSGDWPYHLLAAQSGYIDYVDGLMSHYRIHGDAAWSTASLLEQWVRTLSMLMEIEVHLGSQYPEAFARSRANLIGHMLTTLEETRKQTSEEVTSFELRRRAEDAEAKLREAEGRITEAEFQLEKLEFASRNATFLAREADLRVRTADLRIAELELAAKQAAARSSSLEIRATVAERIASEFEARARGAEELARASAATAVEAGQLLDREKRRLRRREKRAVVVLLFLLICLSAWSGWIVFS